MSVPARDADAILAELGQRLDRAYSAAEHGRRMFVAPSWRRLPRSRWSRARWAPLVVAAVLLGGPAAVATHDSLFTDPPPALPGLQLAPGAVTPDAAGTPVFVGHGVLNGVAWRLSASICRYGVVQAVGLFLDVPGGGAGARCDVASRLPGSTASPAALGQRRIQRYVDPVANRTWVFGVLPIGAASVAVRSRALADTAQPLTTTIIPTVAMDAAAATHGIPAGLRMFVVALPGARDVASIDVRDGTDSPMLHCGRDSRCLPASSEPKESRP